MSRSKNEFPNQRADVARAFPARQEKLLNAQDTPEYARLWPVETPVPEGMIRVLAAGPTRDGWLTLPEADHITLAIQRSGKYYESELLEAISRMPAHGTFVDVGAHYGNHAVFFGLECRARRIVAIEPNPTTYEGLVRNLAENGLNERSTALHAAIHPEWRRVDIEVPEWSPAATGALSNTGMSRVGRAAADGAVDAMPLDEVLHDAGRVGVIKIDVEGNALGVVRSGEETIRRYRPLLVIEALSDDEQAELVDLLVPLGYQAFGPYNWTPTWIWAIA